MQGHPVILVNSADRQKQSNNTGGSLIEIMVYLNGKPIRVVVDCGAMRSVGNKPAIAACDLLGEIRSKNAVYTPQTDFQSQAIPSIPSAIPSTIPSAIPPTIPSNPINPIRAKSHQSQVNPNNPRSIPSQSPDCSPTGQSHQSQPQSEAILSILFALNPTIPGQSQVNPRILVP